MSREIGQNQAFPQQSSTFPETFTAFFYLKARTVLGCFTKHILLRDSLIVAISQQCYFYFRSPDT